MKEERINDLIDNQILKSFSDFKSLNDVHVVSIIKSELRTKIVKFTGILLKDVDVDKMLGLKFDEITPIKVRYGIANIRHCKKRINDLNWLLDNKYKFKNLSNTKVFNLIKLKDKLSF
jgi:hypothetical protein